MKALKTLVAVMSLLIVAGLGLLGWGLIHGRERAPTGGAAAGYATAVPLPAGARVEQVLAAGERVVLRIAGPGGERLVVLDPAAGRVVGRFDLAPATAP
jgi:hypothetical protein